MSHLYLENSTKPVSRRRERRWLSLVVCAVAELAVWVGVEVEMEEYREEMLGKVEEEVTHLRMSDLTPRVEHWLMVVEVRRREEGIESP